jgi:hypothetical protein
VSAARQDETSQVLHDPATTVDIAAARERARAKQLAERDRELRVKIARRGVVQAEINAQGRQKVNEALRAVAEQRAAEET